MVDGLVDIAHTFDKKLEIPVPFIKMSDNAQIDETICGLKGKSPGMKVLGTSPHAKDPIYSIDLTTPLLVLLGNETDGLNRRMQELCDTEAIIPMDISSSANSLNVSCAASIVLYEIAKQRKTM